MVWTQKVKEIGENVTQNFSFSALQCLALHSWNVTMEELVKINARYESFRNNPLVAERLKVEALYSEFIADQKEDVEAVRRDYALVIPHNIDYCR